MTGTIIFTVGHSTHPLPEFCGLLRDHRITVLADVRTVPRSRHNPQFNGDSLPAALAAAGMEYLHLKELGGLRRPAADSPNSGWRNASFRGYADYMQTDMFALAVGRLIDLALQHRVALMCAEAVPWRCHRSLIADALLIRGMKVEHILSRNQSREHRLTPFAHIEGLCITYPAG